LKTDELLEGNVMSADKWKQFFKISLNIKIIKNINVIFGFGNKFREKREMTETRERLRKHMIINKEKNRMIRRVNLGICNEYVTPSR